MTRPLRLRRSQLSVPGSSEKMLAKAAQSAADHVFCDLEDAVAPVAKVAARDTIATALNTLDWGRKTRCVRVNDITTEWCHDDIITIVTNAGANLDTIMLTKAKSPSDVLFADALLNQLERKLGLERRIGLEVLIEEIEGLQAVDAIARCSPRMEAVIFGMGDYSAAQGIDLASLSGTGEYPGDIFHYARFRIAMAARSAGIDGVDGPYVNFRDDAGYRTEAKRARALGLVGKWAIHPSQIQPALEVFSPDPAEVARIRRWAAAYAEAEAQGLGAVQIDGVMIDVAVIRAGRNLIAQADLIGMTSSETIA